MTNRTKTIALLLVLAAALGIVAFVKFGGSGPRRTSTAARGSGGSSAGGAAPTAGAPSVLAARAAKPDPRTQATASIAGTIRSSTSVALAGALVCADYRGDELAGEETREPICASSGPDGGYTIARLPPGEWGVGASAAGHAPGRWNSGRPDERGFVTLTAGEAKAGIDLVLDGGAVRVAGVVSDINGGPIAGALVELTSDSLAWSPGGRSAFITRTADDGTFEAWAPRGEVSASATADGYADGEAAGVAPTERLEVLLSPESTIAGIVVEAGSGQPVAGARVSAASNWGDSDGGSGGSAISGADGRFRISRLTPGRYKPTARGRGYYGAPAESVLLGLGESADDVRIEVHPMAMVAGTVMIEDGAGPPRPCPEHDCYVSLTAKRTSFRAGDDTDAGGKVEIEALLAGTYTVSVWSERYVEEDVYPDVVVDAQDLTELVWKVHGGGTIVGRVTTSDGKPVARAQVHGRTTGGEARAQRGWAHDTTDADGTYAMRGVTPGEYELEVEAESAPGPDPGPRAKVTTGQEVRVDIELDAGGTLTGTVVDTAGKGVSGATIWLQGTKWGNKSGRSGDSGAFEIPGLRPDDYRVLAFRSSTGSMRKPGSTDDDVQGERVKLVAGQTANVRLVVESQDGVITGTVTDASGQPVPDAYLSTRRESDAAGAAEGAAAAQTRWGWDQKPVVTDTGGTFKLTELAPGRYTIRAYRRGGGEAIGEHIAVGSTARLVIKPTGSIAGTVSAPGGTPPEQVTIQVRDDKVGFARSETFFRTAGAFAMRDLPAGTFVVRATGGGAEGTTTVTLTEGQQLAGLVVELSPKVTLVGRLVDLRDGTPVPGITMSAAPTTAGNGGFSFSMGGGADAKERISDADGRFSIVDAPTGAVTVTGFTMDWKNSPYGWFTYPTQVRGTGKVDLGDLKMPRRLIRGNEVGGDLGFDLKEAPPGQTPDQHVSEVSHVRAGGPAEAAGLKAGDVINTTDGVDITGGNYYLTWTLWNVPVGTKVVLGLASGAAITITAGPQP